MSRNGVREGCLTVTYTQMAKAAPNQSTPVSIPTSSTIQARTQEVFHVKPCLWQIKVAEAILQGDKDVLCIAGTGMGKLLTFWIPLLFWSDGIQIVVTPLNLLGKQNIEGLAKANISVISISSETVTPANFHVSIPLCVSPRYSYL